MKIGDIPIKRDLEFHPRRELWSRYEILAGEASVWLRHILTKLLEVDVEKLPKEGQIPEGGLIHQTQVVVTAFFPESYKGTPAKRPISRKGLKDGKDLDFQAVDEPFSEYILPGTPPRLLRLKSVATSIRWYPKRYNIAGDPIVEVDSQVNLSRPRKARDDEIVGI